MASSAFFELAAREIVELHDFFVDWFVADERPAPDFARFADAMAADVTMIPPEGEILQRAAIIEHVSSARGTVAADFSIRIEDIWPAWENGDAILVCYVEVQWRNGGSSRRRSSVLLSKNSSAPLGVEWRHLHETWLQMPDTAQGN